VDAGFGVWWDKEGESTQRTDDNGWQGTCSWDGDGTRLLKTEHSGSEDVDVRLHELKEKYRDSLLEDAVRMSAFAEVTGGGSGGDDESS